MTIRIWQRVVSAFNKVALAWRNMPKKGSAYPGDSPSDQLLPVYKQSPPDKLKRPAKKLEPGERRYANVPMDQIE